ncbi:pentatricopeptide repeat-containing protein At5g66520-like [Magnolia sinica]|uniref:pentatricopeptide repeat-containing protein At5g66520-like n=1 Tax=Magnolia sinica TaxID=86752 RepID=UPI0026594BB7|nr:pentatricopeptide repeat-containing protein At5g66520-like [Magnolia sinica]
MLVEKVEPNESVLVNVLSACAHLGAMEQGKWIEGYVTKKNVGVTVRLGTALVDMYSKCGCVERALEVFNEMKEKNVRAWSTMIGGLAINGHGEDALCLFSQMEMHGVRPNNVMFVGVLNACSHSRLVDEGSIYFDSMTKDSWECPIGRASRKQLLELEPDHSGRYVLLSNIDAAEGKWGDVAVLRREMKERGVSKMPGCSFIDLRGTIHEFIAGDNSHQQSQEIYAKLEDISKELKLEGHTPNTSAVLLDMDEEEKQTALYHHSEKLAIAFGLINSDPGVTIRITKNLRVCEDCHAAAKMISRIYKCKIVVRDRIRFHHFEDGSCSCMDFW